MEYQNQQNVLFHHFSLHFVSFLEYWLPVQLNNERAGPYPSTGGTLVSGQSRHVARISSRSGLTWRGSKVFPTNIRKLLRFGPLFFGSGPIHCLFSYFYHTILFFPSGGHGPLGPHPLATSLGQFQDAKRWPAVPAGCLSAQCTS